MEAGEKKWYLLQAKPNRHDRALRNLRNQDLECYSPSTSPTTAVADKKRTRTEPLFPGYIFIKLPLECNWPGISSTRGVKNFVRFGQYPFRVPDQVVESLYSSVERFRERLEQDREFRPGDVVSIAGSGFENFDAIYKCRVGSQRSIVLIQCLYKLHEVSVRNERLKRVGSA